LIERAHEKKDADERGKGEHRRNDLMTRQEASGAGELGFVDFLETRSGRSAGARGSSTSPKIAVPPPHKRKLFPSVIAINSEYQPTTSAHTQASRTMDSTPPARAHHSRSSSDSTMLSNPDSTADPSISRERMIGRPRTLNEGLG
jgi:hypothetical protein